ncbi:hypothetical protein Nepgr_033668 [Nepenthes gracilis]|uniref:Uncharacterized protein n=1 Tax=Nepenthes gracilis TaxID=150966 RepID=A0AAD3TM84_NEPGR|nr:hypothetical protein Nepgr_033668 [Nepenthes gracilis]
MMVGDQASALPKDQISLLSKQRGENGDLVPLPTALIEGSSPVKDYALQPLVHTRKKNSFAGKIGAQSSTLPVEHPAGAEQNKPTSCISYRTVQADADDGILPVEASTT